MSKNRSLISISDLTREEIENVLDIAETFKKEGPQSLLQGKILASLFFEPSTRTRLSFEAAMYRLGGNVIGFSEGKNTSAKKGETLSDAIRVVSSYADALVVRHPMEGAARLADDSATIPVINAGDGSREHPTQTLLDLFTIRECQGKLDGLKIACVGDMKYGRTAHSLAIACAAFNIRLYFVSPDSLMLPDYITHKIKTQGVKYSFHRSLEEVLDKVDILYMTRTQEERFPTKSEYEQYKNRYVLTQKSLVGAKKTMRILHPLPRVGEISPKVDKTEHAYYFTQAENGLYVRQAVLFQILGGK